jgi:hypothetical protein
MDIQKLVDAMNAQAQMERAQTQVTLGELVLSLKKADPSLPVTVNGGGSIGNPHSYRGYYCDIAFERTLDRATVAEVLAIVEPCLGQTFQGYKGGDFAMGKSTPVFIANYGDCGLAMTNAEVCDGAFRIDAERIN